MIEIPLRPDNDSEYGNLSEIEKNIIVEAVLLRLDNTAAYLRFTPEYAVAQKRADAKGFSKYYINKTGKDQSKQFWSLAKVQEFRDDYERTLSEFFGRKQKATTIDLGADISEEDKAKALRSMFRYVIDNSIDIEKLDDPTTLLKIADKIGFFDQLEHKQISPIRVLPARCSECRYKAFVESSVLEGTAIDCCAYCKCRRIAEEHGYRFNDGKDLLEIPENLIKGLEEKNNVKLEDIISGRIQN